MKIETNSRQSFLITFLSITLISVQSSFVGAVAEFRDSTLILPYVLVGDELYSVELVLADNRDPLELSVGSYYRYADSASAPTNSAFFEGNVLSIPLLRFQDLSYKIQLDYITDESVFRLLEPISTLTNSTDGVLCAYLDNSYPIEEKRSVSALRELLAKPRFLLDEFDKRTPNIVRNEPLAT